MAQEHSLRFEAGSDRTEPFDRLSAALDRIAAAAGRREEALRVAELNAQAAQHENALLREAGESPTEPSPELIAEHLAARLDDERLIGEREDLLREIAGRLDALIGVVGSALDAPRAD